MTMPNVRTQLQRGVSLVETMVAMVIGMLVTLVIYQLYTTFEGQKRTTTSGGDTQINGMFAMSMLEREIRMTGWGLSDESFMDCASISSHAATLVGSTPIFDSMMPATIIDGGDAAGSSDTIELRSATSVGAAAPAIIGTVTPGSTELRISSTAAFKVNDLAFVASGTNCTVSQVTGVDPATGKIQRATGSSFSPWVMEKEGSRIFSLGAIAYKALQVTSANNLEMLEAGATAGTTAATQIAGNIVAMKAVYGISAGGASQDVVQWVRAVRPATGTDWSNPGPVDARRIKAIRLAIVTRSPLLEKPNAAGACTTTSAAPIPWTGINTGDQLPVINLTNTPSWGCYRYRTFQTIIPLRNVIWANV